MQKTYQDFRAALSAFILSLGIVVAIAAIFHPNLARAFEPTAQYSRMNINGWTVYVSSEFSKDVRARNAILKKIKSQTAFIATRLSGKHLKVLRKSDLWVEAGQHYRSLARHHASKGAIYQEGLNIDKFRDVEIFGGFARQRHPSLVLHELAHVYHDRKLSWHDSRIERMYKKFKATMPSAKDRCGRSFKAYALENHHEFFATFTESYFGKTCTYPHNRETIQKRHPEMYAFLTKTWGSR